MLPGLISSRNKKILANVIKVFENFNSKRTINELFITQEIGMEVSLPKREREVSLSL